MPNPMAFLAGFHLHKNTKIDGSTLTKISIKHIVLEQYKKYSFPLTIDIISTEQKSSEVLRQFKEHVNGHKIINSQYGNPYDCYIQDFSIKTNNQINSTKKIQTKSYTITCMGFSDRIYKKKSEK